MKPHQAKIPPAPVIALSVMLALSAILLLQSCDGGTGLLFPDRTWVAIDPVQCLGNPWEQEWLSRHPGQTYPGDPVGEERIIRGYYARFGVDVYDILSIPKYEIVCRACSCPRGDALYLLVRDSDVETMLGLGFRREWPGPFPFSGDTGLIGIYDYTGYDSSGALSLIRGWLTFERRETTSVSGKWILDGPEGYGPQVGTGDFTGLTDGRVIRLNLNPGWADNNVLLAGELDSGGVYSGAWEVITFAGVTYAGRFDAVKHQTEY